MFALDVETGRQLWTYQSHLDKKVNTVCCGWTSRGVAIAEGKVFLGRLDGRVVALDQQSGQELWSVQAERWEDGFTITSAPLYYDGMVITGFAGAEFAARGRVRAFSAKDGSLLWTFYTVPGPGEYGHDTWPQDNDAWEHGGATVWQTPAIDPKHGLIYWRTRVRRNRQLRYHTGRACGADIRGSCGRSLPRFRAGGASDSGSGPTAIPPQDSECVQIEV